jgi:hypothetical protein
MGSWQDFQTRLSLLLADECGWRTLGIITASILLSMTKSRHCRKFIICIFSFNPHNNSKVAIRNWVAHRWWGLAEAYTTHKGKSHNSHTGGSASSNCDFTDTWTNGATILSHIWYLISRSQHWPWAPGHDCFCLGNSGVVGWMSSKKNMVGI